MIRGHHRYTYPDYVALEQESSTKHEFLDGEISGGRVWVESLQAELIIDEIYRPRFAFSVRLHHRSGPRRGRTPTHAHPS